MKISDKLINIKNEEIVFYKSMFSKEDYIKFLELLRNIDSKPEHEISTIYKKLIENTLIRQRQKLRRLLKDTPNLTKHLHTIISIGDNLHPLVRRYNELSKRDDIHRIIDVNNEELIEETKSYLGGGEEEESDDPVRDLFEYLIFERGLENKNDNVFFTAFHMRDVLDSINERVVHLK